MSSYWKCKLECVNKSIFLISPLISLPLSPPTLFLSTPSVVCGGWTSQAAQFGETPLLQKPAGELWPEPQYIQSADHRQTRKTGVS